MRTFRWIPLLKRIVFATLASGLLSLSVYCFPHRRDIDSESYIRIAQGREAEVVAPYSSRVLHPLLARGLAETGIPLEQAFILLDVACLLAFLWILSSLLEQVAGAVERKPFCPLCLLASPVLYFYCSNPFLPDLPVAFLTALFFWLLWRERWAGVLLTLFLLQVARESTVVLTFSLALVLIFRRPRRIALYAVLATAAGACLVSWLMRAAQGNIHDMGKLPYLVTKVIANGSYNLLGIEPWSDVYAKTLPHFYPDAPLWKTDCPNWLPLGSIREVGIYSFVPSRVVSTLRYWFCPFGLIPIALLWCLRQGGRARIKEIIRTVPVAVLTAILSGAIFFLLVPFSGRSVSRIAGYAWPLFWIAAPYWLDRLNYWDRCSGRKFSLFCLIHILIGWSLVIGPFL